MALKLYDAEDEAFKGRFYDRRPGARDRVFEFTISKVGTDWVRVFKPVSGVDDG